MNIEDTINNFADDETISEYMPKEEAMARFEQAASLPYVKLLMQLVKGSNTGDVIGQIKETLEDLPTYEIDGVDMLKRSDVMPVLQQIMGGIGGYFAQRPEDVISPDPQG